jgi:hypothetical protein
VNTVLPWFPDYQWWLIFGVACFGFGAWIMGVVLLHQLCFRDLPPHEDRPDDARQDAHVERLGATRAREQEPAAL